MKFSYIITTLTIIVGTILAIMGISIFYITNMEVAYARSAEDYKEHETVYVNCPCIKSHQRTVDVEVLTNEKPDLFFIGDSRFVGMMNVNTESYPFYCEVGKGYNWYKDNIEDIYSYVDEDTKIVFGLGVNDLYNINKYLTLEEFPYFEQTYFMSVNPVNETVETEHGYSVLNRDIDSFNSKMQELFGDRYIDTNSYLTDTGFSTGDGIHYTKQTYEDIYDYVIKYFN